MNWQQFSRGLLGGTLLALGSVWIGMPSAQANLSDITGAIITSGDIAGGAFAPNGGGTTRIAFRSNNVAQAVNQAAAAINQQLSNNGLPVLTTGISTTSFSTNTQQLFLAVLTQGSNAGGASGQLIQSLVNNGVNPTLAQNMIGSLQGLTQGGNVNPAQFVRAVNAYNAIISTASGEALLEPSQELLAIQSVLANLTTAALSAN